MKPKYDLDTLTIQLESLADLLSLVGDGLYKHHSTIVGEPIYCIELQIRDCVETLKDISDRQHSDNKLGLKVLNFIKEGNPALAEMVRKHLSEELPKTELEKSLAIVHNCSDEDFKKIIQRVHKQIPADGNQQGNSEKIEITPTLDRTTKTAERQAI